MRARHLHIPPHISRYLPLSPEAWRRAALPNPNASAPYPPTAAGVRALPSHPLPGPVCLPYPPAPRLVAAHYPPPPTHAGVRALPPTLPRLVAAHYEGEPRGEWTGGAGPMLLRRLAAGVQDPGARGVGAALREHLVCDELLQLQRKQQSQLLLNAAFHEAPSP